MKKSRKCKLFKLNPVAYAVMMAAAVPLAGIGTAHAGAGLADSFDQVGNPRKVPTYYANSPSGLRADPLGGPDIDTGRALRKFVDPLPGFCAPGPLPKVAGGNGTPLTNKCIPVAVADTTTFRDADYYEIGIVEYEEWMHADLPKPTRLRGYVQLNDPANPVTRDAKGKIVSWPQAHYLGPLIVASKDRPVRIKYTNLLPTGAAGDLFVPVDTTLMGAGMGPNGTDRYTQNRALFHLHGGDNPWISDGTPYQWITPGDEATTIYKTGDVMVNVPDMPDPGAGSGTLYWPNGQSGRLMFYHDHSAGITRLNVYVGEAAGYLLVDPVERGLVTAGVLPADEIPLVIQDRTFVPKDIDVQDAKWTDPHWGKYGDLWFPHVYEANQDPNSVDGTNPPGRWDYGPWFWPIFPAQAPLPEISTVPEAFHDTPIVNGTAYPTLTVDPKAYRFRVLNAANDRFLNLSLFEADPTVQVVNPDGTIRTGTEVKMVPAAPTVGFPADWPTDNRDGGVPDPATVGPDMIQIGNEGGLLPMPAVIPPMPVNFEYNRRSITVLNIWSHALYMGPAERADLVIDFSKYAGKTLILYNDSPAPVPAFDPRIDYYTGNPDQTGVGGAPSTKPGFGPNTRTIMQIKVANSAPAPAFDLTRLQAELPRAYAQTQPRPVVAQAAYNNAFGTTWGDTWAKIFSGSIREPALKFTAGSDVSYYPIDLTTNTIGTVRKSVAAGQPVTDLPVRNKAIAEEFEPRYGRMNATLGVELPLTNFVNQTTMWMAYIDPATEVLEDGETQLWKVTHNGVDTHPIHFHLVNVQLINRIGWDGTVKPPAANEVGWKETVKMNPLEDIVVAVRAKSPKVPFGQPESVRLLDPTQPAGSTMGFTQGVVGVPGFPSSISNVKTNFGHEYVWHCHILGHEENDMMRPLVLKYTAMPPAAPTRVSVVDQGNRVVSVNWIDATPGSRPSTLGNKANEIGFRIMGAPVIGGVVGTFAEVGRALANATSFRIKLPDTGDYAYRVIAFNSMGEAASNTAQVSLPAIPAAPMGVTASVTGTLSVALTWADRSSIETGFEIERCTIVAGVCSAFSPLAKVGASIVAFTDTAIPAPGNYKYRVRAVNTSGASSWGYSRAVNTDAVMNPPGNLNLRAKTTAGASVSLGWSDRSVRESGYRVEYASLDRNGGVNRWQLAPVGDLGPDAASYGPQSIGTDGRYRFRVSAVNGTRTGTPATIDLALMPAPSGLTVTNRSSTTVSLSWTDNSRFESGYLVERRTPATGSAWATVATTGPNVTSFTDTGLTPKTGYSYRVRAFDSAIADPWTGSSDNSNQFGTSTR